MADDAVQDGPGLDDSGIIALVGGDEFKAPAAAFDRLLLSVSSRMPASVAVLPTAAAGENPQLAAEHGVNHFEGLGARSYSVMILDAADANDERLVDELRGADIVYLVGGNPAYLLDTLRDSAAWTCVVELAQRGVIIAGSSAGAMVMGERMRYRGEDFDGLALAGGVMVLPHFERASADRVEQVRSSLSADLTMLGIDGSTGCIRRGGEWLVEGPGQISVIGATGTQVYGAGARFTL